MPTRTVGRSSVSHSNRRTPASSRAARGTVAKSAELVGTGVVRVWSEASVTVNVGEPGFIKFTHGFEMLSKSDERSIVQTERKIFAACEKVVDSRLKKLARLLRDMDK